MSVWAGALLFVCGSVCVCSDLGRHCRQHLPDVVVSPSQATFFWLPGEGQMQQARAMTLR